MAPGTAVAATRPGQDVHDSLRASLRAVWEHAAADPGKQQVLYELTQYALRTPGLSDLATWQYQRYFQVAQEYLDALTEAAHVTWALPLPTISGMVVSMLDGLTLNWLVDRDSEKAHAVLDGFAAMLATLARPATTLATAVTAVERRG